MFSKSWFTPRFPLKTQLNPDQLHPHFPFVIFTWLYYRTIRFLCLLHSSLAIFWDSRVCSREFNDHKVAEWEARRRSSNSSPQGVLRVSSGCWIARGWKVGVAVRGKKSTGCRNCILWWVGALQGPSDQLASVVSLTCRTWKNISNEKVNVLQCLNHCLQGS